MHSRLQGSTLTLVADLALGVVMPIHSHISVNGVISDYVPKAYMGAHAKGLDSRVDVWFFSPLTLI